MHASHTQCHYSRGSQQSTMASSWQPTTGVTNPTVWKVEVYRQIIHALPCKAWDPTVWKVEVYRQIIHALPCKAWDPTVWEVEVYRQIIHALPCKAWVLGAEDSKGEEAYRQIIHALPSRPPAPAVAAKPRAVDDLLKYHRECGHQKLCKPIIRSSFGLRMIWERLVCTSCAILFVFCKQGIHFWVWDILFIRFIRFPSALSKIN
jgi:hypothetical protein